MKKTLLATTALAVSGFVAGQAAAVNVELYGQVNKAVMFADDGQTTDFSVVDNDVSSTRFGLKGTQALDNGLTASMLLEGEIQTTPSNSVSQATAATNSSTPTSSGATFSARHARVGLAGDWGAVFVGTQSTATDSVTEQDMVGVSDLMYSDVQTIGGGYQFRTNTGAFSGTTVTSMANNFDGNFRQDAVRYDSPIFNGFQGRASVAQGGDLDMAVYYDGKFQNVAVKAALGYVMFNDQANNGGAVNTNELEDQISGSVTAAMDNGLAATVAYGQRSLKDKVSGVEDPSFYYLKAGYSWDAFEVAADYGNYEDQIVQVADNELTTYGLGGQYNLGEGVSLAAMYRNFDADIAGTDTDSIDVYTMSMRVKF